MPRSKETRIVIEELFSRPGESDRPISGQEYWVLAVIDFIDSYRPGFEVQQSCARWSEIDLQFMCIENESERWPLLLDAEERYEARRLALMKKGFVHSDMEF